MDTCTRISDPTLGQEPPLARGVSHQSDQEGFPVERVGQGGDVAQCRGLGGSLGERVVLQAVLGDRLGDDDGAPEQLVFGDELLEQSKVDGLLSGEGLAEQCGPGGNLFSPGVGEYANVDSGRRSADRDFVQAEPGFDVGGDAAVTDRGRDQTTGEGVAVDGGNGGPG